MFKLQVINGAGHHVYLDKPELFNKYVLEACSKADNENKGDRRTGNPTNENVRTEQPTDEEARTDQPTNEEARTAQPTNENVDRATSNDLDASRTNQSQALPS